MWIMECNWIKNCSEKNQKCYERPSFQICTSIFLSLSLWSNNKFSCHHLWFLIKKPFFYMSIVNLLLFPKLSPLRSASPCLLLFNWRPYVQVAHDISKWSQILYEKQNKIFLFVLFLLVWYFTYIFFSLRNITTHEKWLILVGFRLTIYNVSQVYIFCCQIEINIF